MDESWHAPLAGAGVVNNSQVIHDAVLVACPCRRVQAGKPWFEGCMTGIGDSAHATRPDLGQGGAMALEVCLQWAMLQHS